MKTDKKINGKEITYTIEGRLDTNTSPDLDNEISSSLDGMSSLVFDFAKLEYVSSAGLRVLLKAYKAMTAQKGTMVIRNVPDGIKEVLTVTGLNEVFTIE